MILLTILVFIIILGLLVFVHEFGHFVMAKRAGMHVQEFGFGFPPRLFGIRRGETMYSVNWIPLGGFVKIAGEEGHSDDPRAFANKSFGQRLATLLAGVTMNFILGWFLIFLGFLALGAPTDLEDNPYLANANIRSEEIGIIVVQGDSPAEAAGFRAGDVILSVDGQKFTEIMPLIDYTKSRAGSPVNYELKRGKKIINKQVVPRTEVAEGEGPVGFAPAKIGIVTYPTLTALKLSLFAFVSKAILIFSAFGLLIKNILTTGHVIEGLSGPVGIAVLTRDFTQLGIIYLVQFAATLSINLGVINAFPFPALDGGRVLFLFVEKIRGKKSIKWEQYANVIGFALLMLLMVAITFRDVGKFSEQFKNLFERIL
ncbi:MAG: RIP metalloprotease RseP [Candidatus Doudnabacteria bacterium]|nr:RIP metalloprotease RseP [Candidatus Doudnabacteria bacterium]